MHQKITLKIMPVFVSLLILVALLPPVVLGDGGAFYRRPNIEDWISLPQEKQIGIINYKDGYEKLILVINVKNSSLQGDKAAWIFPVPSDPKDVNIDILDTVPTLEGNDIRDLADDAINEPYPFLYLSQIYTFPLFFALVYTSYSGMLGTAGIAGNQYMIYEHIEKKGMTTEKVGANNSEAFQVYLDSNDLSLPDAANAIIDEYIGQNYCFIVSWISDVEEFRREALAPYRYYDGHYYNEDTGEFIWDPSLTLGVSINFPAEKIYYPLKLTSIYDDEIIPIFIQVIDCVTPSIYPDVSQDGFMRTNYYVDDSYSVPINLTTFFAEQVEKNGVKGYGGRYYIQNFRYTEIEIHSKAKYLTEDLWIDDSVPVEISILDFIALNACVILILIFIVSSCLASLLAGIIVYYGKKPSLYKFALLGLSNFASLFGFYVISYVLNINQTFVKIPDKKKSYFSWEKDKPKIAFIVLFSIFFIIVLVLIQIILQSII